MRRLRFNGKALAKATSAYAEASLKAKDGVEVQDSTSAAIIKYGTYGGARIHSAQHDKLVVWLPVGNIQKKYTPEQYAQMLDKLFKHKTLKHRTQAVFFIIKDSGTADYSEKIPTSAIVYI